MNFTTPRYAILFSNSENHIVHVINHEWNRFMFVASAMCFVWDTKPELPPIGIRARFSYYVCITCDWDFRIKESSFLGDLNFCQVSYIKLVYRSKHEHLVLHWLVIIDSWILFDNHSQCHWLIWDVMILGSHQGCIFSWFVRSGQDYVSPCMACYDGVCIGHEHNSLCIRDEHINL